MTPVTEQRLLLLIDQMTHTLPNFLNRVASALERASNAYVLKTRAKPRKKGARRG